MAKKPKRGGSKAMKGGRSMPKGMPMKGMGKMKPMGGGMGKKGMR